VLGRIYFDFIKAQKFSVICRKFQKLNGGSATVIFRVKTVPASACDVTLPVETLSVANESSEVLLAGMHCNNNNNKKNNNISLTSIKNHILSC
jgi:hypothetical protein